MPGFCSGTYALAQAIARQQTGFNSNARPIGHALVYARLNDSPTKPQRLTIRPRNPKVTGIDMIRDDLMLDSYFAIATHPFLYIFLGFTVLMFAVQWATGLELPKGFSRTRWLQENYVRIILAAVLVLFVAAMTFYLVEVSLSVTSLVDLLRAELQADHFNKAENLRNLAYATATLVAVLAGSATIFFSSIRVWINERNTRAAEQGLITDRINSAVEGLGAEKIVKKDGVETTVPNIEVRIGAILALERIAKENSDFHIQIMEILCAYIRNNSKAEQNSETVPAIRMDIQLVLEVIGRRGLPQRRIESEHSSHQYPKGFRANLSRSNLSGANLAGLNFRNSIFESSLFIRANVEGANLSNCSLRGSNWSNSNRLHAIFLGSDVRHTLIAYRETRPQALKSIASAPFPSPPP